MKTTEEKLAEARRTLRGLRVALRAIAYYPKEHPKRGKLRCSYGDDCAKYNYGILCEAHIAKRALRD